MEVTSDSVAVTSIKFKCKSSEGETYLGPFGTKGSKTKPHSCKDNEHISNFFGSADAQHLTSIDINCASSERKGGPEINIEKDKKHDEETFSMNFDDKCHSLQHTPVRRPVAFKIYWDKYINAIKIQYKSVPVELNCEMARLEIVDDTSPNIDGYQILGTTVGSTCSDSLQQLWLSVLHSTSNEWTNSNSSTVDITYGLIPKDGLSIGEWIPVIGAGSSFSFDLNFGLSGHHEWVTGTSASTSNATAKSYKTTINYQGPGAAVLVGYVATYEMPPNLVDAKVHYRCEGGSKRPSKKKISYTGPIYHKVHFQDFHFPFSKKTACTTKLRVCISRITLDGTVKKPKFLAAKLKTEVNRCLIGKNNR